MEYSNGIKTNTRVEYHVLHGVKNIQDRRKVKFDNSTQAAREFKARQKQGVHVDVFEVEITTTANVRKMT